MTSKSWRHAVPALMLACMSFISAPAMAQAYPNKQIKIV